MTYNNLNRHNNFFEYKSKDIPILNIIIDDNKVDQKTKERLIDEMIEYFIFLNNLIYLLLISKNVIIILNEIN